MFVRVESTHYAGTWHSASALTQLKGNRSRSARRSKELQHNNGLHPTANSAAFIRETPCLMRCVRGG